jgi:hypothetical protein
MTHGRPGGGGVRGGKRLRIRARFRSVIGSIRIVEDIRLRTVESFAANRCVTDGQFG